MGYIPSVVLFSKSGLSSFNGPSCAWYLLVICPYSRYTLLICSWTQYPPIPPTHFSIDLTVLLTVSVLSGPNKLVTWLFQQLLFLSTLSQQLEPNLSQTNRKKKFVSKFLTKKMSQIGFVVLVEHKSENLFQVHWNSDTMWLCWPNMACWLIFFLPSHID